MNRLLATLPLLLASLCLAGPQVLAAEKTLNVVASFYPMYVTTLNVAAGVPGVTVTCLTEPFAGCLHDYQLKPGDLKTLSKADVFVANGAGMESFLNKVLTQLPNVKIIDASEDAKLLPGGNAHVWVSILGAISQVKQIAQQLSKADPEHATLYTKNADTYAAQLQSLHDEMASALKGVKNRDIITFHEAFPYFAAEFDLNVVGVVEREPGAEPNARELADTIKLIRSRKAAAVFAEPQYSSKSAEVIGRETGMKVSFLDPVSTGPVEPEKARGYYVEAMRKNLAALQGALGQ